MKMLNIGLTLDSVCSDKYVHEVSLWAKSQPHVKISVLVVHARQAEAGLVKLNDLLLGRRLHRRPAKMIFKIIVLIERMLLRQSRSNKDHYRSCDLAKVIDQVVEITPIVSKSGHVYRFSDEDVAKVKDLDLDLLIRCGSGILSGGILRASRLGIVSFHHGDNQVNRGGPPGFWESYYREPKTGFIIQRLTEELDAGEVLVRGYFATRFYYSLNQAHVYKKSLAHLKNLLKQVASTGTLPPAERHPAPYSHMLFRTPNVAQC